MQFDRRIKEKVLRSLVKIRIDDALALLKTGKPERRSGALYLAGYAVECALKAKICLDRGDEFLDPQFFVHNFRQLAESTHLWTRIQRDEKIYKLMVFLENEWSVVWRYQNPVLDGRKVLTFVERVKEFQTWLFAN